MVTDNKSLIVNLLALLLIVIGYTIPEYGNIVSTAGYFALSGALTNWLAIYMLFERVPYLYGSGIVPLYFEEFKIGIKQLIMNQFFTQSNIQRFFEQNLHHNKKNLPIEHILNSIDLELIYQRLVEAILESKFGSMLAMVGGEKALAPIKEPLIKKLHGTVHEIIESETFQKALVQESISTEVQHKIEAMVDERLKELTPMMVKKIIQDMMQKHLGWLVVWGGVFGGLIGVVLEIVHLVR